MNYRVLNAEEFLEITREIIGIQPCSGESLSYRLPQSVLIRERLCLASSKEPGFLKFCEEMERFQDFLTSPFGLVQLIFEAIEATAKKIGTAPVAIINSLPKYIMSLVPDDEVFAIDTISWLETFRTGS